MSLVEAMFAAGGRVMEDKDQAEYMRSLTRATGATRTVPRANEQRLAAMGIPVRKVKKEDG